MAVTWRPIFDWDGEGWRNHAACRFTNPDLFFPNGNTGAAVGQTQAAKAVCRSCTVRERCLQFALATNQEAGIWGGKDEDERRRLRRAWRADRRPMRSASIDA